MTVRVEVEGVMKAFGKFARAFTEKNNAVDASETGWDYFRREAERAPSGIVPPIEAPSPRPPVEPSAPPDCAPQGEPCAAVDAFGGQPPGGHEVVAQHVPPVAESGRPSPPAAPPPSPAHIEPPPPSSAQAGMSLGPPAPPPGFRRAQVADPTVAVPHVDRVTPTVPVSPTRPEQFSSLSKPTASPTRPLGFRTQDTTAPLPLPPASPLTRSSVNPPTWAPSLGTGGAPPDAPASGEQRMPAVHVVSADVDVLAREAQLLGAFGKALERCMIRHSTDVLETVLGAHQEHHGDVIHALSDARKDYADFLEKAIQRLAVELSPDCIMNVGETFRLSAGEITGALRRGEHLSGKILETLRALSERVEEVAATVAAAAASLAPKPNDPVPKPSEKSETLRLKVVSASARADSPLYHLDDDQEEVT